tara:strand:+ start:468 stop:890 length:423 start_codon:yes stop_codon:yes gene_type:complete
LNRKTKAAIIISVILVAGVSAVLYSQGYFGFLSPEPTISLVEVSKYAEKEMQIILVSDWNDPEEDAICVGTNVSATFTLVNSGDVDGFATIQLEINGTQIVEYRYFVGAGEESKRDMSGRTLSCNVTEDDIQLLLTVERS